MLTVIVKNDEKRHQTIFQRVESNEQLAIVDDIVQARREGGQGGNCPGARRVLGARPGPAINF